MARIEYTSNNSGGSWWLSDDDWLALERDGWKVRWIKDRTGNFFKPDEDGRWLGALATDATLDGVSLKEAIARFERVTGQDADAAGCPCCGEPHYFRELKSAE